MCISPENIYLKKIVKQIRRKIKSQTKNLKAEIWTIIESNLGKVVPTTLLKLLPVMGNFLDVFQELNKNSFQYKKHLSGVGSQVFK